MYSCEGAARCLQRRRCVKFTGLAQILPVGPTFWPKILVRGLKLAQDMGQPGELRIRHQFATQPTKDAGRARHLERAAGVQAEAVAAVVDLWSSPLVASEIKVPNENVLVKLV